MPLYEYHCKKCDSVFEALRSVRDSQEPAPCPLCGREAARIMPTTFASMSRSDGWKQRVPFHHSPVRTAAEKTAVAPVKPAARRRRRRQETETEKT